MKRVLHQPAYVLHSRAYRETSALIELWSQDHGRFTVMARGVRKQKSKLAGILQPFTPLLVSFVGSHELMTLTEVELQSASLTLKETCLFAGLYLNELMMYLLQRFDPHPRIYLAYEQALKQLQHPPLQEFILREFELCLLAELGYGLFPAAEDVLVKQFQVNHAYLYFHEQGFILDTQTRLGEHPANRFLGSELLAIAKYDWHTIENLSAAKRLMRLALQPLLGSKAVYSRQLFLPPEEIAHA